MSSNSMQHRVIAALVASLAITAGVVTPSQAAETGDGYTVPPTQSCKDAKLAAWFERQRQLTDGDTNPSQRIALPQACQDAGRMAEASGKQVVAGANAQASNEKLR